MYSFLTLKKKKKQEFKVEQEKNLFISDKHVIALKINDTTKRDLFCSVLMLLLI